MPDAGDAPDAPQVVGHRRHDVDRGVGVVGPLHRRLADAQPEPLGHDEQLGVEEPRVVLDERQQLKRALAPDGLEATLEVRDAAVQRQADDVVVGARDQLALGPAHDPRPPSQPRAHRDVAVAGDDRAHQREQGRERGRQVDVHVGHHVGPAGRPGRAQRVPAALAGQHQGRHPVEGGGQPLGEQGRPVRAAVVGDGDEGAEGEGLVEVAAQRGDARLEAGRLVVHGDDDLDLDGGIVAFGVGPGPVGPSGAMVGRVRPPRMGGHGPSRCVHPTPPRHERRRR